jgi:hypothetical protein
MLRYVLAVRYIFASTVLQVPWERIAFRRGEHT